jgi:hypothetical protein
MIILVNLVSSVSVLGFVSLVTRSLRPKHVPQQLFVSRFILEPQRQLRQH